MYLFLRKGHGVPIIFDKLIKRIEIKVKYDSPWQKILLSDLFKSFLYFMYCTYDIEVEK